MTIINHNYAASADTRGRNPFNRYYVEWRGDLQLWTIIESNSRGVRVVATADTVESAACEVSILEAIEGACRIVQNGNTSADDVAADSVPHFTI